MVELLDVRHPDALHGPAGAHVARDGPRQHLGQGEHVESLRKAADAASTAYPFPQCSAASRHPISTERFGGVRERRVPRRNGEADEPDEVRDAGHLDGPRPESVVVPEPFEAIDARVTLLADPADAGSAP